VPWDHVEVAGFWRVVRGLLGDVVAPGIVRKVPVAGKDFAKNRVQGLFDSSGSRLAGSLVAGVLGPGPTEDECASR
jgi:hypothetical protein